jgi:hypothetical protein
MRSRIEIVPLLLLLVTACGGGSAEISSPCDLADADMVQTALGGTVSEGVEGDLLNCDFDIEGGPVLGVSVYDYDTAGSWDGTRQGFVDNRGGVTDVDDLGDAAFYPNDVGPQELVVQAGGRIFSVSIFTGLEEPSTGALNGLADLADAIATNLAS